MWACTAELVPSMQCCKQRYDIGAARMQIDPDDLLCISALCARQICLDELGQLANLRSSMASR